MVDYINRLYIVYNICIYITLLTETEANTEMLLTAVWVIFNFNQLCDAYAFQFSSIALNLFFVFKYEKRIKHLTKKLANHGSHVNFEWLIC